MAEHVSFHGFLPQVKVLAMLQTADLYVQSSLHEAAGVSVLEAAASGVPTVGTLAGYVADWSPSMAMAVSNAMPESLAALIMAVHADPEGRHSMAKQASTFALAHDATWSAIQFDRLYQSLKA
jgi:glycosyltransferase involved in cell wall biosynthesis